MALLDLSLVTRTFTSLLEGRIRSFPVWPASTPLVASGGPPDLVSAPHALSFYLYHVREDAHTRTQEWSAGDTVPQRFKPMGLTLYYLLTPRSNFADPNLRALAEQLIMGLALKTLRDLPVIDDTSTAEILSVPTLVLQAGLRNRENRLRIALQPVAANEAGQYWQSSSQPLRLAAHYEVSATLLEADEPPTRSGRVLSIGLHTIVRGQPVILKTMNRLVFTPPGENTARDLEVSPAEVAYGQAIEVHGSELKGDRTTLLIGHRDFVEPVVADTAWNVTSDGNVVAAVVRQTASGQALVPGIYGAIVRTTARSTLSDGSQRDFDSFSNESAFVLAPRIVNVTVSSGVVTITVDGFEPHLLAVNELLVFAGMTRLVRITSGAPAAGQYIALTAAGDEKRIRFRFPASAVAGDVLPLRVIVRGAESQPRWEVVP